MRSLIQRIFFNNWLRKLISLILSFVIWYMVYQSMTTTRTVASVPIRIINLPDGKTFQGMLANGYLSRKVNLSLTGRKIVIEDVSPADLEVVIDATKEVMKSSTVQIEKRHLVSFNPNFNVGRHLAKIDAKPIHFKMLPLVEDLIPVHVMKPIGEAPRGFQFLDMWPYQLNLRVKGPEDVITRLKTKGIKLNLNLADVSSEKLEEMTYNKNKHVVSYFVPEEFKQVLLPELSDKPIPMTDKDAKFLRIDFIRSKKIPIPFPIPVQLYVAPDCPLNIPSQSLYIGNSDMIQNMKGLKYLAPTVYAQGVSELFIKIVANMMTLSVNLNLHGDSQISWSIQFIDSQQLEDRYINAMLTEVKDIELEGMNPRWREEYLRNRFRNYMNRLELITEGDQPLDFRLEMKGKEICLLPPEAK
ncbi:MAG: hypothetical protein A3F09_00310 [Chlamydiae bacterium RIFCSPHIGHO2_12_FULL_49_11]|nr:MAG: hypothetical protein A3F09_00310 [Chlamydiae bacterium RIFCSPHIGHO2_12_FULL_49_11]